MSGRDTVKGSSYADSDTPLGLILGVPVLDDAMKIDFLAGLAGTSRSGVDVRRCGRPGTRARRYDDLDQRAGLGECGIRGRDLCLYRTPSETAQNPADDADAGARVGCLSAIPITRHCIPARRGYRRDLGHGPGVWSDPY